MDTSDVIRQLEQQKAAIESAIAALNGPGTRKRKRKGMSASARARIAQAQRKRWRLIKGGQKKK